MLDMVALVPAGRVELQAEIELVVTHWPAASSILKTKGPPLNGPQ